MPGNARYTPSARAISFEDAVKLAKTQSTLPPEEHGDLRGAFPAHNNLFDPPLRVLEFENCIVNRHGFLKLEDGAVITDIGYRQYAAPSEKQLGGLSYSDETIPLIDEPVLLIGGHNNYYHWHFNWMPRIMLADRFEALRTCKLLTHAEPAPYIMASLERATARKRDDMMALNGPARRLRRVFVPTFFMNPIHAPFVLRSYEGLRGRRNSASERRIYISRSKDPVRRIINNNEVAFMLQSEFGVETVNAEDLTYDRQIALFNDSTLIVSAHGAGLTNMLFSSPGFSVIELMNEYYTKVYWSLCNALGGRHYRQLKSQDCRPDPAEANAIQAKKNADFVVDLAALRQELDFVI